jgi:hypothetical protein
MTYRRKTLSEPLGEYVSRELEEIEKEFALFDFIRLKELHNEPVKLFTGLTVMADGTDWNPGSGQGIYSYYGAAWHKLG